MLKALLFESILFLSLSRATIALSTDTWEPISVGLMMQRSLDPSCPSTHDHLMKRSLRQSRRDYKQTVGSIQRMSAGGILLPDELEGELMQQQHVLSPAAANGTAHHQHGKREEDSFKSIITWYTGSDLLDPSCISEGKWNPTDDSMIAAVTLNWAQKPPCGSFLELRRSKKETSPSSTTTSSSSSTATSTAKPAKYAESVIVRVLDSCAGCKAGVPHVDLTKSAFRQLYALDVGLVPDIEVKLLKNPPFDKWGKQEEILYGPQNLGKSKSKGKNNGGADWTSSRDDSWTSKNGSPNWTSDAAPKVLATPTPQNQVTGGGGKAKGASSSTTSAGTQSSGTNSKGKKAGESETSTGVKSQESSDDSGWHNWGSW